jgi:hypothetical protein
MFDFYHKFFCIKSKLFLKGKRVKIEIKGAGTNVWAFAFDNYLYDKILNNPSVDPVSLIMKGYEKGHLICWGLDIKQQSSVDIIFDGYIKKFLIQRCDCSLGCTLEINDFEKEINKIYINKKNQDILGENFSFHDLDHMLLQADYLQDIVMNVKLPISEKFFNLNKFDLITCQLDSSTFIGKIMAEQSFLFGQMEDIRGVIYNNEKIYFQVNASENKNSIYRLLSKTRGDWVLNDRIKLNNL